MASVPTTASAATARFTIPAVPPRIHRRLRVTARDHGLLFTAEGGDRDQAVLIRWGPQAKVEPVAGQPYLGLEIGCILGIIRLWDEAYVLISLPSQVPPTPLFPSSLPNSDAQKHPFTGLNLVHTLRNVHYLPLSKDRAEQTLGKLAALVQSRDKRGRARRYRNLLPFRISGPGAVPLSPENSDEDSDDDDDGETSLQPTASNASLPGSEGDISSESFVAETPLSRSIGNSRRPPNAWVDWLRGPFRAPASKSDVPVDEAPKASVQSGDQSARTSPVSTSGQAAQQIPQLNDLPKRHELQTKIINEICREFSSGAFFYSHDTDLTHSLQYKRGQLASRRSSAAPEPDRSETSTEPRPQCLIDDFIEPDLRLPLWRRVDRQFFWNESMLSEFLDLGLNAFILPVMQGWVQSATFSIPVPQLTDAQQSQAANLDSMPVDIVIISRRSRNRAGLRYQRRGIDDDGHVANLVETEMVVRTKVEGKLSLFSFVQVRGSIPLKWSQSPFTMRPAPVLDQPLEQSYSPASIHFDRLVHRYGPVTIVNLAEQSGKEGPLTDSFSKLVQLLGHKDVKYQAFDFHAKCHGMKWENISELVNELDFDSMGYMWTLQGEVMQSQHGIFRTNCIDCLDRTNVVQSALARHVLSKMLLQVGFAGQATPDIENVFNDVWANNGDTLSLCYAHTSALKGDFVRTGKRDFAGMLHDGFSSISRMFYGAISDFFSQAVISFFLGQRNLSVFSEFLETLQSSDATSVIRLCRIRAAAIEVSSARVIYDGETRESGWTLLSPEAPNETITSKLEEKILLLTRVAVYIVSFNYNLEKVMGFTRIPLSAITSLQLGSYILSSLQEASRDPVENYGFIIRFLPSDEDTRYSTYSLRNKPQTLSTPPPTPELETDSQTRPASSVAGNANFFAFKILPRELTGRGMADSEMKGTDIDGVDGDTCKAAAERVVQSIAEACITQGRVDSDFIQQKAVVSLAEAEQSTSLLKKVDYALKRLLWL